MIDLHCHMLPSIDDGAVDLDMALKMASVAEANGISRAVLTPHLHCGRYDNDKASINQAVSAFARELQSQGINLDVRGAAEIRMCAEIPAWVEDDKIPWLGDYNDYRVFLLEFPHSHIPHGSENLISYLVGKGVLPMIAHPERNKEIMRNYERILPLVSSGCLLQVTAGSVAGLFGDVAKRIAVKLLEDEWVTVLASDAHNLVSRVPDLKLGERAAADIVGAESSKKLVSDNPWRIVESLFA